MDQSRRPTEAPEVPKQGHVADAARLANNATNRCPQGHQLPHDVDGTRCTPLWCVDKPKEKKHGGGRMKANAIVKALPAGDVKDVVELEDRRFQHSMTKAKLRREYLKVPEGLTGPDAEAYVQRKMVDLTPDAVAELEFQLKIGDDRQRMTAAQDILDRAGFGKRDGGGAAVGPIMIINAVGGSFTPPWAVKAQPVDGEVVKEKEDAQDKP